MGGYPPMQGQEPMPSPEGYNNGFGGGMNPMPAMNQPQPMGPGQMPAPNTGMAPAPVPPMPEPKSKSTLVETIILVVVCIIAAVAIVFAVLFFMRWNDLNADFTAKKDREVAEAVKAQQDADNEALAEKLKEEKEPFSGPEDFGLINFSYPKVWKVYEAQDGTNNSDYMAYFAPTKVGSINDMDSRYALRFQILNRLYDTVASTYAQMAKQGILSAVTFSADNGKITGTRFTGDLSTGIVGIVVVAKVNDKTLILQTDSQEDYENDFNKILDTLRRGN